MPWYWMREDDPEPKPDFAIAPAGWVLIGIVAVLLLSVGLTPPEPRQPAKHRVPNGAGRIEKDFAPRSSR